LKVIVKAPVNEGNRDGSVGIATGYGVRFPSGARDSSVLHSVQTYFRIHPASYVIRAGDSFPGSSEVRNSGAIPLLPNTCSWRDA
jgi:hypothetical protein